MEEKIYKKNNQKRTDNTTLVVSYHPVLRKLIEIFRKAHKYTLNSIDCQVYSHHQH